MERILIVSYSFLHRDPRVIRQIKALHGRYELTTVGLSDPEMTGVRHLNLRRASTRMQRAHRLLMLLTRNYEAYYDSKFGFRELEAALMREPFKAVIANDIDALPFASRIAKEAKLVFDAHEYSPEQHNQSVRWRLVHRPFVRYVCRTYIPKTDKMMTVSDGIADRYAEAYGVRPLVVTNAAEFVDLAPTACEDGVIRVVYHGAALRSRSVETILEMMSFLDGRFRLDCFLVAGKKDEAYVSKLKAQVLRDERVRFLEPVPLNRIVETINRYDVGVYSLPPINFNTRNALPNKIFEFVQARLAIATGPMPEVARLVETHGLGVVSPGFTAKALAQTLGGLDKQAIMRFKNNAHAAARELSAEQNMLKIAQLVSEP